MAAFKNKDNGTWYVQFRYTDWKGERQQKLKRGFATKREALEWEREFLMEKQADVNMTFESFVALYLKQLYGVEPDSRMFPISKSYLHREMDRGCKQTGVKRIRIHDLRHSHISLLIDMGFTALAIAERVGHESIDITYRYAHLFPTRQVEMADKLDSLKNEKGV